MQALRMARGEPESDRPSVRDLLEAAGAAAGTRISALLAAETAEGAYEGRTWHDVAAWLGCSDRAASGAARQLAREGKILLERTAAGWRLAIPPVVVHGDPQRRFGFFEDSKTRQEVTDGSAFSAVHVPQRNERRAAGGDPLGRQEAPAGSQTPAAEVRQQDVNDPGDDRDSTTDQQVDQRVDQRVDQVVDQVVDMPNREFGDRLARFAQRHIASEVAEGRSGLTAGRREPRPPPSAARRDLRSLDLALRKKSRSKISARSQSAGEGQAEAGATGSSSLFRAENEAASLPAADGYAHQQASEQAVVDWLVRSVPELDPRAARKVAEACAMDLLDVSVVQGIIDLARKKHAAGETEKTVIYFVGAVKRAFWERGLTWRSRK